MNIPTNNKKPIPSKGMVLIKGSDLLDPKTQDDSINKILDELLGPEETETPAEDQLSDEGQE